MRLTLAYKIWESFRFWDENDYEYDIFSILSIDHPWNSVMLPWKRDTGDSRRHSITRIIVVAWTSNQM